MQFVEIKFIKKGKVEFREYQDKFSNICLEKNCLIVAPTGLGKTVIAALFIAKALNMDETRRFLIIAPTRVLVGQHATTLKEILDLDCEEIMEVTGEKNIEERKNLWSKRIVIATAEVTLNDLEKDIFDIKQFYAVIFDEAHHAIGDHPYAILGKEIFQKNKDIRIIGFTASPPLEKERVQNILDSLKLSDIETITEEEPEVKKYIFGSKIIVVKVKPTAALNRIRQSLLKSIENISKQLKNENVNFSKIKSLKELLELRRREIDIENKTIITSLIRIHHCLNLVETYGIEPFIDYCEKIFLKKGKSVVQLKNDPDFRTAYEVAKSMQVVGEEHPKVIQLKKILTHIKGTDNAIVFTNHKYAAKMLFEKAKNWNIQGAYLIGKRGSISQSQKEQLDVLEKMKEGIYRVLFATRVGEEGLDISECNTVIFYDNVSDAIRFVQRKGRTGRKKRGKIIALIMEGTKEEAIFWAGKKKAEKVIKEIKKDTKMLPLEYFIDLKDEENSLRIIVDHRENDEIKHELSKYNIKVEEERLEIGDFLLSEEVCVERKTIKDFVESIIDGRLFSQALNLKQQYTKPIIIIEKRGDIERVSLNSFYGALASLISDFNIPIIITESNSETAFLLYSIAKREQIEKKKSVKIREGTKPLNIKEVQKYVLAGIPGISAILAERLLEKFGTLQRIFNADENELMEVKGIGETIAKRIREIVTLDYNKLK
ncbi:MAG: ERCC4 domain-containing protein [Candidatus Aenigmatarchaeota archaeon]